MCLTHHSIMCALFTTQPWVPYSPRNHECLTHHSTMSALHTTQPWVPYTPLNHAYLTHLSTIVPYSPLNHECLTHHSTMSALFSSQPWVPYSPFNHEYLVQLSTMSASASKVQRSHSPINGRSALTDELYGVNIAAVWLFLYIICTREFYIYLLRCAVL